MNKKLISILCGVIMAVSLPITSFAKSADNAVPDLKTDNTQITTVNSGTNTIELKDGQRLEIPLVEVQENNGLIRPNTIFYGNAGYVELWVSGNHVNYKVVVDAPANRFVGTIRISDSTSGLSGGVTVVSGFSGYATFARKSGHTYVASFGGTAFAGIIPVARSGDWTIRWTS